MVYFCHFRSVKMEGGFKSFTFIAFFTKVAGKFGQRLNMENGSSILCVFLKLGYCVEGLQHKFR